MQRNIVVEKDLFVTPMAPDGFIYRADLITAAEERDFATACATLPFKPFEFHGHLGNRRIVSFGWRYDYAGRTLRESAPLPGFLLPLREAAASLSGLAAEDFQQALITEYAPGAGIGWHRDKPMFEDVVGISFLSPCVLRFRRRSGATWDRISHMVQPRSGYLLRGPARQEWEHSIPNVTTLRYSVTFRTFGRTFGT